jgi:hypothetical protein
MHPELSDGQARALAIYGTAGASGTGENAHLVTGINQGLGSSLLTSNPNGTEDQKRTALALMNGGQYPTENTAVTTQQQALVPLFKPVTFDPNSQAIGIPAMMSGAVPSYGAPAAAPQTAPAPTAASPVAPSAGVQPTPAAAQPQLGNALQQPGVLTSPDGLGPKYMRGNLNKVAAFFSPEVLARTKANIQNEKLLLALDQVGEMPTAFLPPGTQPEKFEADQTQPHSWNVFRQLAGTSPTWFGNPADQKYAKISSQIQMGGGLGSTLAGKITNEQLGVAGQSTPNVGMTKEARININRDDLVKNRQMEDAQEFVARAYNNRQLTPQIGEILSGFAQSPEATNIQMDPETKLPMLVPKIKLKDYVTKNYPDLAAQIYSGPAPDINDPNFVKQIQQQLTQPSGATAAPVASATPQDSAQLSPAEQAELMARRAHAAKGMQTGGGF